MNQAQLKEFKKKIDQLMNHYKAGNYEYVFKQTHILNKKYPENSFLANLSGSCLRQMGEFEKAKKFFIFSLKIDKNNIAARNNLGNIHRLLFEFDEAEKHLLKVLDKDPNYIQALNNLGSIKYELNKLDEAIKLFQKVIKLDKNSIIAHFNLGLAFQGLGNNEKAIESYQKIQKINPNLTIGDNHMSRIIKYDENNDHFKLMLNKIKMTNLEKKSYVDLHFSLGKAYEDFKKFDNSFYHIQKGNNLKNELLKNYNLNRELNFSKTALQNHDSVKENIQVNSKNKKLLFIIGLPRSGTSLTEQILASHSSINGCGEVLILEGLIKKTFFDNDKINLKKLNNIELIEKVNKEFYQYINKFHDGQREIIIDKTPQNFMWIGIIKKIFPDSKFIHCVRERSDNCLSIYKTLFDGGIAWSYNLENILDYYKNYKFLMEEWEKRYSESIFKLSYEDMITNPEQNIKKMLNFCNLNFEDNCLNFYKNSRPIKTMSISQARKPIYKSSVGSSEKFNIYLKDFFKRLNTI